MARRAEKPQRDDTREQVAPTPAAPARAPASGDDADRIAQRAYERYTERGGEPGRDQEDWFQAERDLRERDRATGEQTAGDADMRALEPSERRSED